MERKKKRNTSSPATLVQGEELNKILTGLPIFQKVVADLRARTPGPHAYACVWATLLFDGEL